MNNDEMLKATLTEEELNARYPHVNRAWKVENLQFYIICARPTELPEQSEMLRTFCEIFKDAECVKYEGNVAEFTTGFCGNERVRFRVTAGVPAPELTDLEWSDTWKNEDAEGIMNRCQHSVLVEEVDMASYGKQKLGFEINLIGLTDKMFRPMDAEAMLFRPSGRLTETMYIREYFEDPMMMLHHPYIAFYCHNVMNVRYAEENGSKVVDSLGLGVLGFPDINFYFRKTDQFEVMNLCDTTASTLVNSDWPVEDGGRIPNFRTGKGDFECHYVSAFLAPMREVLDITVDTSFPKVFMNCPPTTSAQA